MSEFLRARYRALHDRFGTAGVVLGVIALIAALGGSALAAGGLTKAQEKQVTKIAKKYAGKPGAPGAAGTNGTNGKDGSPGTNGTDGSPGKAGDSVVSSVAPPEVAHCKEGGSKFVVGAGTPTYACNGAEGEAGEDGSPWTVGNVLPSKATETGNYLVSTETGKSNVGAAHIIAVAISFPIALLSEIDESHAEFIPSVEGVPGEPGPNCQNTEHTGLASPANPEADPGFICVFERTAFGLTSGSTLKVPSFEPGALTAGTFVGYEGLEEQPGTAIGTWAVTAP